MKKKICLKSAVSGKSSIYRKQSFSRRTSIKQNITKIKCYDKNSNDPLVDKDTVYSFTRNSGIAILCVLVKKNI